MFAFYLIDIPLEKAWLHFFSYQLFFKSTLDSLSLVGQPMKEVKRMLYSKPEEYCSDNLWQTGVPFFCYQLIQKVWLLLL